MNEIKGFFKADAGLISIILESSFIVSVVAVATFMLGIFFARMQIFLHKKYKNHYFNWHIELIKALQPIINRSLWILSIAYILESFGRHYQLSLTDIIPSLKVICIIIALSVSMLKSIDKFETELMDLSKKDIYIIDKVAVDIIAKLLKAIICIFALISIMHALGINISGLIAVGGIGGLAIGFASKDLLSNFFGTIMIYLDKPFMIGESVKIDGKDNVGIIEKVDWRMTTIRTEDKKQLFIPNSVFLNASIENASRMSHRVFLEQVKILCHEYAKIKILIDDVKKFIRKNNKVDTKQSISIDILDISQDIIILRIKCYLKYVSLEVFCDLRNDLLIDIASIINAHGMSLAPLYKESMI